MRLTLRQLRYFDALVRERHFGRAADRVSVSQPALSGQIAELEATVGGQLVERGRPGLPLTPLGRLVAERAARVLKMAQEIEALSRTTSGGMPDLRLGIIPTVAPYLVPHLLPVVRAAGASFAIRETITARMIESLQAGDLDAAVVALPAGARDLVERAIFHDRFLLALPEGEGAGGIIVPTQPEEIDPERLLLLDDGHCLSEQALDACQLRRQSARLSLGASSLATISRLVASGQGITLLPEIAASVEGRGLRLEPFAAPEPGRTVGLVALPRAASSDWFGRLALMIDEAQRAIPRLPVPARATA